MGSFTNSTSKRENRLRAVLTIWVCLTLGFSVLAGCGGGGAIQPGVALGPHASPAPTPSVQPSPSSSGITVALTFRRMAIDVGQSLPLTATVSNDPGKKGVTWAVTCPPGVSACGSMVNAFSASGATDTFNAPSSVTNALQAEVTATSVSDPTKSAQVGPVVNPAPALVYPAPPPPPAGNVGSY